MGKSKKKSKKGYWWGAILILVVSLLYFPGSTHALSLELGSEFSGVRDVSAYTLNLDSEEKPSLATGVCADGYLATLHHEGRVLAKFISPCVFGAANLNGQADPTALVGMEFINIYGMRAGLTYNTDEGTSTVFFGISLTNTVKAATDAVSGP